MTHNTEKLNWQQSNKDKKDNIALNIRNQKEQQKSNILANKISQIKIIIVTTRRNLYGFVAKFQGYPPNDCLLQGSDTMAGLVGCFCDF